MIKKILPLIIITFTFSACKINYSFTGASIAPGTETVSIQSFQNMAPIINPTLSMTFTEAMKDRFLSQTSLKLVQRDGDIQFSGTITGYNTKPTAIQAGNVAVAAMNRLTITIKVKYVNHQDPKTDFDTNFSRYADYESSKNLQDVENQLIEEIIPQIVDDIFNKSVANW